VTSFARRIERCCCLCWKMAGALDPTNIVPVHIQKVEQRLSKYTMPHHHAWLSPAILGFSTGPRLAEPSLVKVDTALGVRGVYTLTQAKNSTPMINNVYHPIISTVNTICNILLASTRVAAAGQFTCAVGSYKCMAQRAH
jgi:hypothetical protein